MLISLTHYPAWYCNSCAVGTLTDLGSAPISPVIALAGRAVTSGGNQGGGQTALSSAYSDFS
jgi:hypothetical protein